MADEGGGEEKRLIDLLRRNFEKTYMMTEVPQ